VQVVQAHSSDPAQQKLLLRLLEESLLYGAVGTVYATDLEKLVGASCDTLAAAPAWARAVRPGISRFDHAVVILASWRRARCARHTISRGQRSLGC
jgi:hypothetical protein